MTRTRDFGALVKGYRAGLDLTQVELAAQIGCSAATIQKIESGLRRPSKQIAELLAAAFQVPAAGRAAFQQQARGLAGPAPAAGAPVPGPRGAALPLPPTSFVGRITELRQVGALLARPGLRLLTLTGPGGAGKSRLGIQAAAQAAAAGEVRLVDLADAAAPPELLARLAAALGLPGDPLPTLADRIFAALQDRALLLVLDNCEPGPDVHMLVAALLRATGELTILATSRAALGVYGEQEFPVGPLAYPAGPGAAREPGADWPARYPALQLFQDRAQAIQPGFVVGAANIGAVAALCACLDGLPLAIELAAARIRCLPPQVLVQRRETLLDLLVGGPGTARAAHQSLRATVDADYARLSADERRLFLWLAQFPPACPLATLEAAWDAGAGGATAPGAAFPCLLESLVRHHLVRCGAAADGEPHFGLPELLRLYAQEQGPVEDTRRRAARPEPAAATAAAGGSAPRADGKIRRFPAPGVSYPPAVAGGGWSSRGSASGSA
ncbi:MAG TPA: helix-turn-helix domain-containing protein [Chloroflexia bacterium]|nr:helix-turn-helix domain-containing protein [Chloroflexia bacterium]